MSEMMNGRKLSLPVLLFLVFLVLKLTKVVDWEWFWVCAPLIFPIGLGLLLFIIYVIVNFAIYKIEKEERKNEEIKENIIDIDSDDCSLRELR